MTIQTLVMGATFSTYGLFVLPVAAEFHLSRADANTGLAILNVGAAVLSPFLGPLLDRVSARRVMLVSCVLFMAGFAVIARSHSLWLNVAVLALVLPFATKGAGTLTAPLLVVRWFTVQRGRAVALSQLGLSLGGFVVAPAVGALIQGYGWRNALMVMGVGAGALMFAIALVIRERPGPDDHEGGSAPPAGVAGVAAAPRLMSVGQILKAPAFWTISLSCGLAAAVSGALLVTIAPLGREQGLSMMQAASLISIMSACGIGAKLLLAVVADRIDRVVLLTILFAAGALLNAGLMFSQTYGQLLAAAAGLGLINAAMIPVQYALFADRFGPASFGTVTGLRIPLSALLGVVGLRYAGEVFDRTGGYEVMFVTFIVVQLVAAATIFATRLAPRTATLATA